MGFYLDDTHSSTTSHHTSSQVQVRQRAVFVASVKKMDLTAQIFVGAQTMESNVKMCLTTILIMK